MFRRYFSRFLHPLRGLRYTFFTDFSFRTQVYLGLLLLTGSGYLWHPFTLDEVRFLLLGWFLVLITELQNSALEMALDRLHPDHHAAIGQSKDLAAAAVLLAGLFLLLTLATISYHRLTG